MHFGTYYLDTNNRFWGWSSWYRWVDLRIQERAHCKTFLLPGCQDAQVTRHALEVGSLKNARTLLWVNFLCIKLLTICGCDNFNILVESSPWLDHRHRNYCGSGTRRSTTVARLNDLVPDSRAASTALELRSAGMNDFFRMAEDNFMLERNLESDSKLK